ncbi:MULTISPECIES: type III-A CRISPR-associated RAMP protein Csm4 [Rodentibacter]|uniref:type III-A CRISPR-associated RAMP protein Csm4 n=1 Tax=Rodentibacter TaxID=1960084 RepID=UPI001CFD5180|nr:RAMP superfamily CRISPR-associated protein [Rodentibacter sp. JRC1]GJI56753.1 CRISPR-associated protein, Csm4 family [Rodentibacter sp. JRC1]
MKTYRLTIKIESAFGTPLVGDTLFGQLCWEIRHQFGEEKLTQLLKGYTEQKPFLVLSDAMPSGYLPLPTLPSCFWQKGKEQDRKKLKKKQWITLENVKTQTVEKWQQFAKAEKDILVSEQNTFKRETHEQPHNTLNRQTHTTDERVFAPYTMPQIWYQPETLLDIYCVIDENRFSYEELKEVLSNIGKLGFGRDASIGLGRFSLEKSEAISLSFEPNHNVYLALGNAAPQQNNLDKERCFYQLTTRFGRHGSFKALSSTPFKKPIILSKIGAIFTPKQFEAKQFIGNGLANVSPSQPNAVHQGYTVVFPLTINFARLGE